MQAVNRLEAETSNAQEEIEAEVKLVNEIVGIYRLGK